MVQLVGSSSLGLGKLIDGKNQFIHIRYSAKPDGSNMTSEIQPDTKYIGIRTSSSETPSINPADYSWGRFVGTSGSSSYTWIRYSANEDGSNMTTIANEDTKYIGVAITDEDSAPTDHTRYSWALFKGSDGRGVERTEVSYQKSTSGIVIPTGSWSASIPSVSDGEYLWTRTLFFYTDGTTTSTFTVSRNGIAGLGIANTDVHYQKSTSGTTVPTGGWTVTIPKVAPNEYLWTRTTITYTDDSTSVSYSVGKMGADGRDAQLLYLTASSEVLAFDKDDRPKTTEAIIISAKLQNASGAATFVAIPYIGNTAQPTIALGGTGNDRTLLPSQWTDTKWTSVAITATLGSLTDTVSVHKVKDGEKGDRGPAGQNGKGVSSYSVTYQAGTSGTTVPTGTWTTTIPSVPQGRYLWTKMVITYTDETSSTSYSVSYIPMNGQNGATGATGNGVKSIDAEFYLSTSKTTQTGGAWSTTQPTWSPGKYVWTRNKITYTNGSTSYTSPQCSSEWEAVNNLQVGGKNLFIDAGFRKNISTETDYVPGKWYQYITTSFNYTQFDDECRYIHFIGNNIDANGIMQFFDTNKLIKGQTYSVRTQVNVDSNTTFKYQLVKKNPDNSYSWYAQNVNIPITTIGEWVDVKWTFTIPKDDDAVRYGVAIRNNQTGTNVAIRMLKPKLEIGNMFTDFSFAPEDTQAQIDQANENISNKVDQDVYNQDKSVIYDDINKKLDDEEFRQFQQIMNELKGSYDSFVGEGGRFEQELKNASEREQAIVQEFGNKVNQLNFINTYIRESEEGIVIGAKNSPMQMLLSKDSLSFMDGGQTVAYFSNQSFYINRGAVVQSLQVGVHKLTKIGNEHTVIQYIPQ